MRYQIVNNQYIPKNQITRPNFQRGTLGGDLIQHNSTNSISAQMIDKTTTDPIIFKNRNAHFSFSNQSKPEISP